MINIYYYCKTIVDLRILKREVIDELKRYIEFLKEKCRVLFISDQILVQEVTERPPLKCLVSTQEAAFELIGNFSQTTSNL